MQVAVILGVNALPTPRQSIGVTLYILCNYQSDVVFLMGPANEVHVLVIIGQLC